MIQKQQTGSINDIIFGRDGGTAVGNGGCSINFNVGTGGSSISLNVIGVNAGGGVSGNSSSFKSTDRKTEHKNSQIRQ